MIKTHWFVADVFVNGKFECWRDYIEIGKRCCSISEMKDYVYRLHPNAVIMRINEEHMRYGYNCECNRGCKNDL